MTFSESDIQHITAKGITVKQVQNQLQVFNTGLPYANIIEPATENNGILVLSKTEEELLISHFESQKKHLKLLKFVPASGASTRMFKFLFQFLQDYKPKTETLNAFINKNNLKDLSIFIIGLEKFPFYQTVVQHIEALGIRYHSLHQNEKIWHIANTLLNTDALNYGNLPKGLLPFHKYKNNRIATALEEHLFETALYGTVNNVTSLHFTISEQHKHKFDKEFFRIKSYVEHKTEVSFNMSFSYQQESTDSIAVTDTNIPFRDVNGKLLFRPSGHGALLKNLNAIDADIIFIKNIDNVVVRRNKEIVGRYKKILAGKLLWLQDQSFQYLKDLDKSTITDTELHKIAEFLLRHLQIRISLEYEKYSKTYQIEYLKNKLNRPIRVCGMVKNEGEPGGGPFWIKDEQGQVTLQIVESAQINKNDTQQNLKYNNACYFNPVDMVCGIKNYKGQKFELDQFIDNKAAFITHKTRQGKAIKALELPGLWNGSMANWSTVFVEVPIATFNPVKTVNDLLKASHQTKL